MRKKRILIVEDQPIYRKPIATTLEANGYTTVCAKNGNSAIEEMKHHLTPFDLILLDYSMPEMNGLEFLQKIRKFPDWKAIPVVMLTGMADKNLVLEAKDLGVRNYMLKSSFSHSELLQIVHSSLNLKSGSRT